MVEHTTENCGVTSPILVLGTQHSLRGSVFLFQRWGIIGGMPKPEKVSLSFMRQKKLVWAAFILLAALVIFVMIVPQIQHLAKPADNTPTIPTISTATLTPTVVATATSAATTTPAPTSTPITPTAIPDSHYLEILAHGQYFALGCEASAAVDLAGYYDVLIYQYNFQHELPYSENPDLGFVGDANGPWGQVPPYAYGVHAAPVATLLQKYGLDVEGGKGYTLEQIKEKLAAGHPVIAWVIGNMVGGVPAEYTDSLGNTTVVAAYEHVVILTGYDQNSIRYVNNGRFYEVPNEVFLNSWGVLGNMAVFHR